MQLASHARTPSDELPVASRADAGSPAPPDLRAMYRVALALLATTLTSLLLARGYGIDTSFEGDTTRRREGDWVSVPWTLRPQSAPGELQVSIDPSACARVVRYEVTETPDTVHLTIWRRRTSPSCVGLSVNVRLQAPLGDRAVVDGGALTPN